VVEAGRIILDKCYSGDFGIEYKIEKGLLTSGGYFKENTNGQLTLEQLEKEPQN